MILLGENLTPILAFERVSSQYNGMKNGYRRSKIKQAHQKKFSLFI